jgi:positive regulator of sigma E activity
MKFFRIFEIVYLVIAVISIYEVVTNWNIDRNKAYIFVAFAVVSVFMFFFRRYYRKKFNRRKNQE